MRSCFQTTTQDMLQHGEAVAECYRDLWRWLEGAPPRLAWDIPVATQEILGRAHASALPPAAARDYHVYHDCGKHLCLVIDAQGRRHYPDHAEHSSRRWREMGGDVRTGELIRNDMVFHLAKGEGIKTLAALPDSPTLLLTAWAEIHANAAMFGGLESESFKIKRKHLIKASKAWMNAWQAAEPG